MSLLADPALHHPTLRSSGRGQKRRAAELKYRCPTGRTLMKTRHTCSTVAFLTAMFWSVPGAYADSPLEPPHRYTVCSSSKLYCVTSDPQVGTFAHMFAEATREAAYWSIPRWFRAIFVSNNPDYIVTGYDGLNLVPRESPGSIEILTFWRRGVKVCSYRLSDLITDLTALQPTSSHYYWGDYQGFDSDGNFLLYTVQARILVFDPTGKRVKSNPPEKGAFPSSQHLDGMNRPTQPLHRHHIKGGSYSFVGTVSDAFSLRTRRMVK